MRRQLIAPAWVVLAVLFSIWAFSSFAQNIFEPAKLDPQHSEHIKKCSACHDAFKGTPDAKCLNCHKNILKEKQSGKTIHGRTSNACNSCHGLHGKSVGKNLVSPKGDFHSAGGFFTGEHFNADCFSCHRNGLKRVSKACGTCHQARGHKFDVVDKCENCHIVSNWHRVRVKHGKGADCKACHKAPVNHSNKQCSNCHTTDNWKVKYHSNGQPCKQCHKSPANHYGPNCQLCHNTTNWKDVNFSHPQVRGHSYRSFSCVACHPNGYTSYSCTCHRNGQVGD
jgi:hypothetical protein